MAPFDGRPPNVLVLGGGGLLGEAWMTGVLAGYEDATGADMARCRRFVGTSAGSIVASSLVAGRSPRRPGSAKAGVIRPVEDPGGAPSPSAGPDREGRQVPNIVVGAGAVAARLGAPIRAPAPPRATRRSPASCAGRGPPRSSSPWPGQRTGHAWHPSSSARLRASPADATWHVGHACSLRDKRASRPARSSRALGTSSERRGAL
jgi:Patatin-like phospholipase